MEARFPVPTPTPGLSLPNPHALIRLPLSLGTFLLHTHQAVSLLVYPADTDGLPASPDSQVTQS